MHQPIACIELFRDPVLAEVVGPASAVVSLAVGDASPTQLFEEYGLQARVWRAHGMHAPDRHRIAVAQRSVQHELAAAWAVGEPPAGGHAQPRHAPAADDRPQCFRRGCKGMECLGSSGTHTTHSTVGCQVVMVGGTRFESGWRGLNITYGPEVIVEQVDVLDRACRAHSQRTPTYSNK